MPGYPIPDHYLADVRAERDRLRACLEELVDKGTLAALRDANDRAEHAEAKLTEAERRIAEQGERIAELYLAQKSKFLSARDR